MNYGHLKRMYMSSDVSLLFFVANSRNNFASLLLNNSQTSRWVRINNGNKNRGNVRES